MLQFLFLMLQKDPIILKGKIKKKKGHKPLTFYKSSELGNLANFQTVSTLGVSQNSPCNPHGRS